MSVAEKEIFNAEDAEARRGIEKEKMEFEISKAALCSVTPCLTSATLCVLCV
jgi:hypothetical protein